jgi:hypothetical protein
VCGISNLYGTCVPYYVLFYVLRPNRPLRSSTECSSADVGSPARWLRYIELNQLGARNMKMHASPAAGRQLCWLASWPAAVNQCADVAALPYRNIHVYTCVRACVYIYHHNHHDVVPLLRMCGYTPSLRTSRGCGASLSPVHLSPCFFTVS